MPTYLIVTKVRQNVTATDVPTAISTAEGNITIGGAAGVNASRKVGSKVNSGDIWQNQSGDKGPSDINESPMTDQ